MCVFKVVSTCEMALQSFKLLQLAMLLSFAHRTYLSTSSTAQSASSDEWIACHNQTCSCSVTTLLCTKGNDLNTVPQPPQRDGVIIASNLTNM